MELNGVNSYYTGYASTASQTNKDNKTSGTASANNYSDTAATYESSKARLFHLLHQNQPILL